MSKHFTLIYPDHSKANISVSEKEDLLLAGDIQAVDARTYKFIGKVVVLHSFSDLGKLIPGMHTNPLKRFYPGLFIWKLKEHTNRELMESPEGMALRLERA